MVSAGSGKGRSHAKQGVPGAITADGRVIRLTNASKVLFDNGVTKGELAQYYQAAAEAMLPLMRDRPVVMMRYPDGIDSPRIVQKNAPEYFPDWISRAEVPKREGGTVCHVVCNDAATLVYLANQACIESHAFLSKAASLECPQELVFDLDPPAGRPTRVLPASLAPSGAARYWCATCSKPSLA